jgi:voltage-dependent potassium channel beta subunit
MEYRHLGRAGVRVSSISLGSWLTYGASVGEDVAIQCIRAAYDLGINLFDTANAYHRGAAEIVVGRALKGMPRESYVLATKAYWPMGEGTNDRGLSRKHLIEQCNASLRRLGVDYVDLYQCHRYDVETPLEETLRALDDLVTQGKVLYVGVSEWNAVQIADAVYTARNLNLDRIVSNQPIYNMLQRYIERDIVPLCEREGIGQIVFSPLAQGVLTGKYRPGETPAAGTRAADPDTASIIRESLDDDTLTRVRRLEPIAHELGCSMAQLALAWVLHHPNVSSAITGASRPDQVKENAAAHAINLSEDVMRRIDEVLGNAVRYEQ